MQVAVRTLALSSRTGKKTLAVRLPRAALESVVRKTLKRFGRKISLTEVSVVITTDARVRAINRERRGIDRSTDVLSFDYGEIILSYPTAARQARDHGLSTNDELELLTVHGLLHILGFDHERAVDRRRMAAAETAVLGWSGLVERGSTVGAGHRRRVRP